MATFKTVKGVSKNFSGLRKVLGYVAGEQSKEKVAHISGINCSDNVRDCYKEFIQTKEIFDNVDGRQYRHHIQSFKAGEVNEKTAHEIAKKFAEENYKGFQVFIATHKDKDHIHTHFIINSVCQENGMKLRELNRQEVKEKEEKNQAYQVHEKSVKELRRSNDKLCKEYGLSVIEKDSKKSVNIYNKKEYKTLEKHLAGKEKSYKLELGLQVREIAKNCKSIKEFKEQFKKLGVEVVWEKNLKNVTFKFEDEKKKSIRLSNLQKTYNADDLTKENLEKIFEKNTEQEQKLKDITKELQEELKKEKEKNKEEEKTVKTGRSAEQIIEDYKKKEQEKKRQEQEKKRQEEIDKYRGIGR